jgi:hypothetical protein
MHNLSYSLRCSLLLLLAAGILLLAGCPSERSVSQTLNRSVRAPEGSPVVLAAYQPWFGRAGHIDVGYSSQDRTAIEKQIDQAKILNIRGFVVNWYGPSRDFEDRSYAVLQRTAAGKSFKTAIMYDESVDDPSLSTDQAIQDLQYAYDRYFGPHATEPREAYLTYEGRPVIFIFPKNGKTNWDKVREATGSWQPSPVLIYKDDNSQYAKDFDGFYAWVSPGQEGWAGDGSNWGHDYLSAFYGHMKHDYPQKLVVGAAWPGFDDSRASWGKGRKMDARCGKTLEDSLRLSKHYYPESDPMPFLMIDTWNDYEEGTAIERGITPCGGEGKAAANLAARSSQ